ncbi:hypothetical protein ACNO7T_22885 [Vibrio campbellii]
MIADFLSSFDIKDESLCKSGVSYCFVLLEETIVCFCDTDENVFVFVFRDFDLFDADKFIDVLISEIRYIEHVSIFSGGWKKFEMSFPIVNRIDLMVGFKSDIGTSDFHELTWNWVGSFND